MSQHFFRPDQNFCACVVVTMAVCRTQTSQTALSLSLLLLLRSSWLYEDGCLQDVTPQTALLSPSLLLLRSPWLFAVRNVPNCTTVSFTASFMFIVLMGVLVLISMLFMVVFIICAVCCYTVAPRVNFSEEIIKYFELELLIRSTWLPVGRKVPNCTVSFTASFDEVTVAVCRTAVCRT